jgi:uncharacterized protein DUF3857
MAMAKTKLCRFGQWAAAGVLLGSCMPSYSGWFNKNQPVPDWGMQAWKTRTPDYAKDSSAVILYDEYLETIDANGRAVEREREAIRILKPQGRGNTCEVSYDETEKVNYFRVWTIAADEKQYQAQDTDFIEEGDTGVPIMLSTRKSKVAHPPAVDVGATIICESEEQMEPYLQEKIWGVQNGIPVVFQALELDLPQGRSHVESWHRHDPIKPVEVAPNHWRWEIHDMPALTLRDIPSVPERAALQARMSVQWGKAAVEGPENQWRAIGQWVTELEANRPDPSPEITAKVHDLIAGAPDFYTRLERITESIQKDIRYFIVMRGIGGLQANHASDIFRNRYGDCKDKTTLLISMLQAIGVRAHYLTVDSERGVINPEEPSLLADHMITAIELPEGESDPRLMASVKAVSGKTLLIFDPTDEVTPVGLIRGELQGGFGMLAAGPDSQVLEMPVLAPESGGLDRTGTFALSADGTFSGDVTDLFNGVDAAQERMFLKETDQKGVREALEMGLSSDLPGLTFKGYEFAQTEKLDQPIRLDLHVSAATYAHAAGPLLLLRARVIGRDAHEVPDLTESKARHFPIEIGHPGRWRDSFDITLPAGYTVDETPDPVSVDVGFASYHSSITAKSTASGNVLHYEREYVVKDVEIPADKAGDFRMLEASILEDEKGAVVLKKN